jgi:hypothetical protein
MAVDSASSRLSMAVRICPRSVVGVTTVVAVPAKVTSPRLMRSGRTSTNSFAAICMAWKRVGATSVASIDSDTSTAITTVARSRGTRTSVLGTASDATRTAIARASSPKATCRRQPGRLGTSEPSSATFVNRAA